MIVCAVDDLIFSIKIQTAAKSLQADVYFERSGDRLLQTIREKRPSLVIFDLNSARLRPLEAIVGLKSDPDPNAFTRKDEPADAEAGNEGDLK